MSSIRFYLIICVAFLGWPSHAYAQLSIAGQVKDQKSPIEDASVVLYDFNTNAFLEYVTTDKTGYFSLENTYELGIYLIEVTRLGYAKYQQTIVVASDSPRELSVSVELQPSDRAMIDEILVRAERPIIVKKDTTIYNIESFTSAHDETLEAVLARIDGFKILADGSISVNGKVVRKVLIDGKEVSDMGAALLTKSISPEDVASVEVRFNEQKNKLKESLLREDQFVVLDIQLKADLNKTFFGKQSLSAAWQEKPLAGGYGNYFSLNKKVNAQLFAEYNNLGDPTISLSQIRNIGEEASAKIFSLPVDFNEMKAKRGYHDEIYGFRNFTRQATALAGLSLNFPITEQTDLYIGTFYSQDRFANSASAEQFLLGNRINGFMANNAHEESQSKTKIQLKHSADQLKILTDVNYVHLNNSVGNDLLGFGADREVQNTFNHHLSSHSFYANNRLEYQLSPRLGWVLSSMYATEQYDVSNRLQTTNEQLASFLGQFDFLQQNNNRERTHKQEAKMNVKSGFGNHFLGVRYDFTDLLNSKATESSTTENAPFNTAPNRTNYQTQSVVYDYQHALGALTWSSSLAYSKLSFPNGVESAQKAFFEYDVMLNISPSAASSIMLLSSNKLGKFPLEKIAPGLFLSDFQTVFVPALALEPFYNTTYSLSYSQQLSAQRIQLDAAMLTGTSNNLNALRYDAENALFFQQADQLLTRFQAYSITLKKRFARIPLTVQLEPEALNNSFEINQGESSSNRTIRYLLGLKLNTHTKGVFDVAYFPKYSHFIFATSEGNSPKPFNFLSQTFSLQAKFFDSKLLLNTAFRTVYFYRNGSHFNNLDLELKGKISKNTTYFLQVGNLFNNKTFQTQDFDQLIFSTQSHSVFGRFATVGCTFKFK